MNRKHVWGWALVLAVGVVFVSPPKADAGAWTQLPNGFYIKLSYAWAAADEQIKCCVDDSQPLLDFSDRGDVIEQTLTLYGEYGLPLPIPGGLTLIASASIKLLDIDTERALRETDGFADVQLGLRWGLPIAAIEPVVLSLQVDSTIPTGYTANLPEGARIPYLGNGIFEVTSSLLAGVSFWPVPVYLTSNVGFRWRGDDENQFGPVEYENELPYGVEAGVTIADRVLIQAVFNGIAPLGDVTEISVAALNPPSTRRLDLGGGLIVFLWEGLQLNANYTRVLAGTNVLLSDTVTVGLAWAQ